MDLHRRHYRLKSAPVVSDEDEGIVEAIVSVFGNVDDYGDRVIFGAFAKSIERSGGVWGVVYSHKWGDVPIGKTLSAVETEQGLLVRIQLLIADVQAAREVYAGMKAGVPFEFSFSYDIKASRWVMEDDREILELVEVDVLEVGPCLIGANRATHLVGVKSHEAAAALAKRPEPAPDPAVVPDTTKTHEDDEPVGLDPLQAAAFRRRLAN